MERAILLIIVAGLIVAGIGAGAAGLVVKVEPRDKGSEYVTVDGECFVRPQGDPLWDAHYAQEVNSYNCKSFKTQAEGRHIEADTRQTDWDTNQGKLGVFTILGIVASVLVLLGIAVIRG